MTHILWSWRHYMCGRDVFHSTIQSVWQYGVCIYLPSFLLLHLFLICDIYASKFIYIIVSIMYFHRTSSEKGQSFEEINLLLTIILFICSGNKFAVLPGCPQPCCSLFSGTHWKLNRVGDLIWLLLIKGSAMHFIVQMCLNKMVTKHNLQWLQCHSNRFDLQDNVTRWLRHYWTKKIEDNHL